MKKISTIIISLILLMTMLLSMVSYAKGNGRCIIYVATNGNDNNDGTIDNPLATLTGARDKIRALKKSGIDYPQGFVVYIREGDYAINESIEFTEQDSGTEQAPIVYKAYQGEKVTLIGGVSIPNSSFKKITDKEILNRIIEASARDKIYEVNLKECGITKINEPYWAGIYSYSSSFKDIVTKPKAPASELFFNGKSMQIARYPNDGFIKVSKVYEGGWDFDDRDAVPVGTPFVIGIDDNRIQYWTKAKPESILLYGFWKWDWADQTVPVKELNVKEGKITSGISSAFSVIEGRPFYAYNLLEEIDRPGEYYIDSETGMLYFYPPSDIGNAGVKLSNLEDILIRINGASYITFKDIKTTATRNSAFSITNGKGNLISNCEIEYTASAAVVIDGEGNGIVDSYLHDVNGGVVLRGGEIETLKDGNCFAINNEIADFSRINKTYTAGVEIGGVGNLAAHNEIHSAPHLAIGFNGNNNRVYYNEIYNVLQNATDSGVIYGGLSWVSRGHEFKYNYIHDIQPEISGTEPVGAIYLDGGQCETFMIGNVVENINGIAFWINGGRDNIAINNIVLNSKVALYLSDIMKSVNLNTHHYPRLNAAPYVSNEYWEKKFPKLQNMLKLSDEEKVLPKNNIFENNVVINTELARLRGNSDKYISLENNYDAKKDPGFVDFKNRNYLIKKDSEIFKKLPEFKAIPFTRMGRYNERAQARIRNAIVLCVNSPYGFVNGKKTNIDNENEQVVPKIVDGTTFVPLRFISEALGANVKFDEDTNKITISGDSITVELKPDEVKASKNGEEIALKNSAFIDEGRTLVPLREVSNLFEKKIFWHDIGFICISDDEAIFDELGNSDDYIIKHLYEKLNIY